MNFGLAMPTFLKKIHKRKVLCYNSLKNYSLGLYVKTHQTDLIFKKLFSILG
jgi:hypothetical protein